MALLQYRFNIIVLLFIAIHCVWSFSVEPKYTKFEYEEQLLEKVVRFEVYVDNLNNAVQKFISDFSIIVNESKKFTEKEISIGNDRINLMKSEIVDFNQNVTSTMAQEQQSIRDLHEKLNEKFETKTNELTRFEEDLNKKFKAKTEELKQYEERMNKMFETKTEELTRLEEQLNQKFENKTEELTRFGEDLNKKFKAKTEELKQYEERMNKMFETKTEELTRLEEQLNQKYGNKTEELTRFEEDLNKKFKAKTEELKQYEERMNKMFETKTEELTRLAVTPLIAFNAYSKTDGSYSSGKPVVFEEVLLNEGGCYDKTTGYFTASVDGIYQFNAQICFLKNVDLEYTINVDSVRVIMGESRAASDSGDEKCDTFSVTTRVNQGQNVFVTAYNTKLDPKGDDWNSFSGSIIRQL